MSGIELRSNAFGDHDPMPDRLSRKGGNASPPLSWSGVPDNATELVLLCEDPDAGKEPFLHWLVTGIEPASDGSSEGETPAGGRAWTNGFGETGWGGPQPPIGDPPHRYMFQLYAVDSPVVLPATPGTRDVHAALDKQALATGVLTGTFER